MSPQNELRLVATCALGLEPLLADELRALGVEDPTAGRGAVTFSGNWPLVWRCNLWLRTANRVLVELGHWCADDDATLEKGAHRLLKGAGHDPKDAGRRVLAQLLTPWRTLAIRATSTRSAVRDTRWVALKVKDGLVDAQRERFGERSSIDRKRADVPLRVLLYRDQATLLLDTSREPLDRRGYRRAKVEAPLREQLAAACVLASGWDGEGPVVDPMCGAGTLLAEAGWWARGWAPGAARKRWVFERWPSFDQKSFERLRGGARPDGKDVRLIGVDSSDQAIAAARSNLSAAGLSQCSQLTIGDAFEYQPPETQPENRGLLLVNPPYGERAAADPTIWPRLGDLLKQRYGGWTAVVLAGDPDRGKRIGLRPRRRISVRNGPIEARILVFDLY